MENYWNYNTETAVISGGKELVVEMIKYETVVWDEDVDDEILVEVVAERTEVNGCEDFWEYDYMSIKDKNGVDILKAIQNNEGGFTAEDVLEYFELESGNDYDVISDNR